MRYGSEAVSSMAFLNFLYKASLVVLCLAAFGTQICSAQLFSKDPAKWWPDPSTGLMWADHVRPCGCSMLCDSPLSVMLWLLVIHRERSTMEGAGQCSGGDGDPGVACAP